MKTAIFLSLILLLGMTQEMAFADDALLTELPNLKQPQQNRIVSGAIGASDIRRIRASSIKHVINLRTAEESRVAPGQQSSKLWPPRRR